eukprot:356274-Chlamydomonas_euryale.AAC.5
MDGRRSSKIPKSKIWGWWFKTDSRCLTHGEAHTRPSRETYTQPKGPVPRGIPVKGHRPAECSGCGGNMPKGCSPSQRFGVKGLKGCSPHLHKRVHVGDACQPCRRHLRHEQGDGRICAAHAAAAAAVAAFCGRSRGRSLCASPSS